MYLNKPTNTQDNRGVAKWGGLQSGGGKPAIWHYLIAKQLHIWKCMLNQDFMVEGNKVLGNVVFSIIVFRLIL